jgi:hypothetical protein
MDDGDPLFMNKEEHARCAIASEIAPQFPQTATERPAQRHSDRPSALNTSQIGADRPAVRLRKFLEPIADGLSACRCPIEEAGKLRSFFSSDIKSYLKYAL